MAEALALLISALFGASISFGMTRKFYRLRGSQERQSVVQSPYAHVFLLPNSLYGLLFYLGIGAISVYRLSAGRWILLAPAFACALLAAVFSMYLAWSLLFRLKEPCPLCFASHVLNVVIAVVLGVVIARS